MRELCVLIQIILVIQELQNKRGKRDNVIHDKALIAILKTDDRSEH